jgi:hypothetical protein
MRRSLSKILPLKIKEIKRPIRKILKPVAALSSDLQCPKGKE